MVREVKLDPEERIIAVALDQAELDDANERSAGADRVRAGRSYQGDDQHFARFGRAGQGTRFDDWGTVRRGDPVGRP
jgi:hypothetical protein